MNSIAEKDKFIIVTTVPGSLNFFKGQIGVLKKQFNIEAVSSPQKGLEAFSKLEKIKTYGIHMSREISLLKDLKSLIKLTKLFLSIKPKIVHGNTPKGAFLSMFSSWITRVPYRIYCVHGLRYQGTVGFKRKLLIVMEQLTCFFATEIIAVSIGVRKSLKEDGVSKKKVSLIWNGSANGINVNHFKPSLDGVNELRIKYNLKPTNFIYGFVGRIVRDKGINEIVEAFTQVNKKYKHTRLILIGKYEDADPIKEKTDFLIKNNKNIIYVGYQKELRPFFNLMDVFTFPTYREGLATSLLEASAMSKAIISSNATGCYEVIKDGYNGRVIPTRSSSKLKEAMIEFIENPLLIKKLSSVSRQSVIEKYEQKFFWKKALETYSKLLNDV